jgi:two-component system, OmpR family, response regulator
MRPAIPTRLLSVLVVDNYPDAAASWALVLNFGGFAARAATSGEEALAAAAAEPPEVVVLEPRMPGGGWELARRLTAPIAGKQPVLVVLTTDTTAAGRQAAVAAGVGLYLIKPESPAALIDALRQFERRFRGREKVATRISRPPRPPGRAKPDSAASRRESAAMKFARESIWCGSPYLSQFENPRFVGEI